MPPDMTHQANGDRRLNLPSTGEVSLSTYSSGVSAAPAESVLKPALGMRIQRVGTAHWLVVDKQTPAQLWPRIRRFWREQGFSLTIDARERGILETDWSKTTPNFTQGLVRDVLSKTLSLNYVTAEKNKYRTRVEAGPEGGAYIFISHKGLYQVLVEPAREISKWEEAPNDFSLETEYLQRLMHALTSDKAKRKQQRSANRQVAATPPSVNADEKPMRALPSHVVADQGSAAQIELAEPFDHAWLHIGLALDNANFTVDDRDRAQGFYYIRYVDPAKVSTAIKPGFWNKILRRKEEKRAKQYRLNIRALTKTTSQVAVMSDASEIDTSPQARQILSLLAKQLR